MGNTQLVEMLGMGVERRAAMAWHLRHNHYPPVPESMVNPCLEAIDYGLYGEYDELVELPEGVTWRGETEAPAWAIIEGHHLTAWLETESDDE